MFKTALVVMAIVKEVLKMTSQLFTVISSLIILWFLDMEHFLKVVWLNVM